MADGKYFAQHKSFWGAYKGSVRGKLGGSAVGLAMGVVVGVGIAAVTALASGGLALLPAIAIIGGGAAAGTLYGMHEFSAIGRVSGAVAAAQDVMEERSKERENAQLTELKGEIRSLKRLLLGRAKKEDIAEDGPLPESGLAAAVQRKQKQEVQAHHSDEKYKSKNLVFWNVAAVGALVGMAVGAVLAWGGGADYLLKALGEGGKKLAENTFGKLAAAMTVGGLFGASYGINRDVVFRPLFDVTDNLAMGKSPLAKGHEKTPQIQKETGNSTAQITETPSPIMIVSTHDLLRAETHYRDQVTARRTLLAMDHTGMRPQ